VLVDSYGLAARAPMHKLTSLFIRIPFINEWTRSLTSRSCSMTASLLKSIFSTLKECLKILWMKSLQSSSVQVPGTHSSLPEIRNGMARTSDGLHGLVRRNSSTHSSSTAARIPWRRWRHPGRHKPASPMPTSISWRIAVAGRRAKTPRYLIGCCAASWMHRRLVGSWQAAIGIVFRHFGQVETVRVF